MNATSCRPLRPDALARQVVLLLALCCLTVAPLIACGGSQQINEQGEIAAPGPDDQLYEYKTVSRQLREHPQAAEVARELDLVDVWLVRAERMVADKEKEELITLQLQAIEGELIRVRSHYARREAELALEGSRSSYEGRMNKIQSQRDRNASQLAPKQKGGSR